MKVYIKTLLILITLTMSCSSSKEINSEIISLQIFSQDNANLLQTFQVEISDDPDERNLGLMNRTELGTNRGMLFVFSELTDTSFWMKDTFISLDIIFIGSDRKIISIIERTEPESLTPLESEAPFQYVLEIEGGRGAALGIRPGDEVRFEL